MLIDSYIMQARRNAPATSDVPTLKHFFPCTETSGTTITDTAGGIVYTPTEITFPGGIVRPHEPNNSYTTATPSVPVTSGEIYDFSTKSLAAILVGIVDVEDDARDAAIFSLGYREDTSTQYPAIFLGGSTTNAEAAGGVNDITVDHWTARPTRGGVADLIAGKTFVYNLTADVTAGADGEVMFERWNYTDDPTKASTNSETVSAPDGGGTAFNANAGVTPIDYIKARGMRLYGVAYFSFSAGIPANWDDAVKWMAWAWQQGYKVPYPPAVSWT